MLQPPRVPRKKNCDPCVVLGERVRECLATIGGKPRERSPRRVSFALPGDSPKAQVGLLAAVRHGTSVAVDSSVGLLSSTVTVFYAHLLNSMRTY